MRRKGPSPSLRSFRVKIISQSLRPKTWSLAALGIGLYVLGLAVGGSGAVGDRIARADEPAKATTYRDDLEFLARHTQVVELTDGAGARVAICPEYQGRVMTSTCAGPEGPSFGWINRRFIEEGRQDRHFNNYGGEDRFWLGPEGGQFALWFAPGAQQVLANWITPPGLNDGPFRIVSRAQDPYYRLTRRMQLLNASGTRFDLDVTRDVRLLKAHDFSSLFGEEAAALLGKSDVRVVGFVTDNTITNRGDAMSEETGLISIWTLGMFPPGDRTYIIIPYVAGDEADLGPVVNADYFGSVPPERLRVTPQAILFHGDGKYRSKIGVVPARARPMCGSIDFQRGVLTLVHYTLPDDPASALYVNNLWDLPQEEPYAGDALNSYNDGPPEPGAESLGGFYELETLSPARPLARGESLSHRHRTFHIQADADSLARLARLVLGVDLNDVAAAFSE